MIYCNGMTCDIEYDLNKINQGYMSELKDEFAVLLFVHQWRMMSSYGIIREHIKSNIFQKKYHTEFLKERICNDIWSDMFCTMHDMDLISDICDVTLLKIVRENGCPWDYWLCVKLAERGKLECLQYAHENSCPWNAEVCAAAAEYGHLDCLKYVHQNGCPWNEWTCAFAANTGKIKCLKYAHENGCPWSVWHFRNVLGGISKRCERYIRSCGLQL